MQTDNKKRTVWILGLPHSGSTIFWKAFRKDDRFLCFDEPLTENLGVHFPRNNAKHTFDEYIKTFGNDPKEFWDLYDPIMAIQEFGPHFSESMSRYLRTLTELKNNVVIDEVHLHYHTPEIKKISPDAYVIHLVRRASPFVTSHLLSRPDMNCVLPRNLVRLIRYEFRKYVFWTRARAPRGMDRDEAIGTNKFSRFGMLLAKSGYDVEKIYDSPAVVRLLAYWHFSFHLMEENGVKFFGKKYFRIHYEDFANDPAKTMERIYQRLEMVPPPGVRYSDVYQPKKEFDHSSKRWGEAAKIAGFDQEEIEKYL